MKPLTIAVAVASPIASHGALALGQGYGVAVALAAAQAVAVGLLLRDALPRLRWAGPAASLLLLAALALGARHGAGAALLLAAGVSHAMLYTGLLAVFATTLRPRRESLVTGLARRLNPAFHAGMVPYTRAVTAAWCLFFAAQLLASATLLFLAPQLWRVFVTTVHAPLVLGMAAAEFAVRRWRWRHEHYTGFSDTVRGVRRLMRPHAARGAARTSMPDAGCPAGSGSAKRPPGPAADTAPGQGGAPPQPPSAPAGSPLPGRSRTPA